MPTKRSKDNDIALSAAAAAPAPAHRKPATPRAKHGSKRTSSSASPAPETIAVEAGYTPAATEIAALAYSYWAGRGYQGGSPEEDWLRAETELRAKASA